MSERTWRADDGTILTEADAARFAEDLERDASLRDGWSRWRGVPEHLRPQVDMILAEMATADATYAEHLSALARAGGDAWQALAAGLTDAGIEPDTIRVRLRVSHAGVGEIARRAARDT